MNVEAVEDRPGQSAEVFDTVFFLACAALAIAVGVTAGAGIGRHDQLESRWIVGGAFRARYCHVPGFQGFAQCLQGACREFGCLVHEQNASVRPCDRAWLRQPCATADQGRGGCGMVRRFEWWNIADAIAGQRAA